VHLSRVVRVGFDSRVPRVAGVSDSLAVSSSRCVGSALFLTHMQLWRWQPRPLRLDYWASRYANDYLEECELEFGARWRGSRTVAGERTTQDHVAIRKPKAKTGPEAALARVLDQLDVSYTWGTQIGLLHRYADFTIREYRLWIDLDDDGHFWPDKWGHWHTRKTRDLAVYDFCMGPAQVHLLRIDSSVKANDYYRIISECLNTIRRDVSGVARYFQHGSDITDLRYVDAMCAMRRDVPRMYTPPAECSISSPWPRKVHAEIDVDELISQVELGDDEDVTWRARFERMHFEDVESLAPYIECLSECGLDDINFVLRGICMVRIGLCLGRGIAAADDAASDQWTAIRRRAFEVMTEPRRVVPRLRKWADLMALASTSREPPQVNGDAAAYIAYIESCTITVIGAGTVRLGDVACLGGVIRSRWLHAGIAQNVATNAGARDRWLRLSLAVACVECHPSARPASDLGVLWATVELYCLRATMSTVLLAAAPAVMGARKWRRRGSAPTITANAEAPGSLILDFLVGDGDIGETRRHACVMSRSTTPSRMITDGFYHAAARTCAQVNEWQTAMHAHPMGISYVYAREFGRLAASGSNDGHETTRTILASMAGNALHLMSGGDGCVCPAKAVAGKPASAMLYAILRGALMVNDVHKRDVLYASAEEGATSIHPRFPVTAHMLAAPRHVPEWDNPTPTRIAAAIAAGNARRNRAAKAAPVGAAAAAAAAAMANAAAATTVVAIAVGANAASDAVTVSRKRRAATAIGAAAKAPRRDIIVE
jgi:hypothetical protein